MIITYRTGIDSSDFEKLLKSTINELNLESRGKPEFYIKQDGVKLEHVVFASMANCATGTLFDNKIQLISGGRFPDIIAGDFWGVEVKSTTNDHWKTTGNSVLESTRVKTVEHIYLIFGKLVNPPQFVFKKYEECLYDMAVTHSPRYLIDMKAKKTIFAKMGVSYDTLRKSPNPLSAVTKYYRNLLKEGEDIWWLGSDESNESIQNIRIRLWSELTAKEKDNLRNEAMARFPEIFGIGSKKYSRLATWLAGTHGIVSPSLRDTFTAGGQQDIQIKDRVYTNVPKIFKHLDDNVSQIIKCVNNLSLDEIEQFWKLKELTENRFKTWANLIEDQSNKSLYDSKLNVKAILARRK